MNNAEWLNKFKKIYPKKFVDAKNAFSNIHRGERIFIGTGCGEPVYLVRETHFLH